MWESMKYIGAAVFSAALASSYIGCRSVAADTTSTALSVPATVDDFRLTDQNLRSHELRQLGDARAIVLITQQNSCPVSRNTSPAVKELQKVYAHGGVEILMLNSTPSDKRESIVAEAKAHGYDLPILMDYYQLVGEQLGVTQSDEAFVIDPRTWKITYRGPIDDRVSDERQQISAKHTWVKDVLDAMLAGKTVEASSQDAVGCLIHFSESAELRRAPISYAKTIAPMIEQKCVVCHQPGGIGPMSLTSYDLIKPFSPMIREMIRTQRMPPWRADPTIGHFMGDRSLSGEQIKTLVHWVESGAPRGSGADPLLAKSFISSEWPLGKPDLLLDMPAYTIPATGIVDYQRPFVANPLKEGKWVRAASIKVTNRQAVHHILSGYMSEVPSPGAEAFESTWKSSFGTYALGAESYQLPPDTGVYMAPGGAIGFQIHYTPFGREVTEHSQIALYFYKDVPTYVMHHQVITNQNLMIPANDGNAEFQSYFLFPKDALLFGAFPHAHYRGASSQLWMQTPDGAKTLLLSLPHYDFNWQREYNFVEPIKVTAGSKLIAMYSYDNSVRNPANPDPNRVVPWGLQSFDEMLYTALEYRWVGETSVDMEPYLAYDKALDASGKFGMFDTKLNGKLDPSELTGPIGKVLAENFTFIDADHDGYIEPSELAAATAHMQKKRAEAAARQRPPQAAAQTATP